MIIHINIIALYMYCYWMKKFKDFLIFLNYNNWPILLKKIEKKSLAPEKITKLYQKIGKKSIIEVAKHLLVCV